MPRRSHLLIFYLRNSCMHLLRHVATLNISGRIFMALPLDKHSRLALSVIHAVGGHIHLHCRRMLNVSTPSFRTFFHQQGV